MADKLKELCKWKRDNYAKEFQQLKAIVSQPRYACSKCGRVADKKKWLCKPQNLE